MTRLTLLACIATLFASPEAARTAPAPLRVEGSALVDPSGQPVLLRGCNLGNWFLFEAWMMDLARPGEPRDHVDVIRTLEHRFGPQRAAELLDLFRENWLRARDFELMREFGFNVIRLPFHYALLEEPARPGKPRPDGFRWLDHAVRLASDAGLYVILDLHGAPGAQSLDHVTGESGRNEFWLPENRLRGALLWEAIAHRYRDHPAVVAYDVLNEPYGKLNMDHDDAQLIGAMEELVTAVRRADPDTLIYCAGALRGIEVYGPPSARGWRNVGFTEHFYPGFYGDETSLATQALFLNAKLTQRAALLRAWNTPYLVGEFNPVVKDNGGPAMLRRYFDAFAAQGWAATMWSYKLIKRTPGAEPEPWYLVTNADALNIPSFATASDAELEAFFLSLGTMDYALAEPQLDALRDAEPPPPLPLAAAGELPPTDPGFTAPEGCSLFNIGDAYPRAAVRPTGADSLTLWGGGRDIFGTRDEFGLLARETGGDFSLTATVAFDGVAHRHAKAGLMFRASPDEDAPFVSVVLFPGGRSVIGSRSRPGGPVTEQALLIGATTQRLALTRLGKTFTAIAESSGSVELRAERSMTLSIPQDRGWLGPYVLSHDGAVSSKVDFTHISWGAAK
ncbi:MAG: cellulase family glycosylhydrolase [Verrucomicrobiota bacterium]